MTADTTATGRPRFVVAYGGDKRSKAALRLGVVLAQSLDAHLDVVLVVRADDPFGAPYPPSGDVGPLVEEQALAWLDEARALVPDDVSLATHLRHDRSVAHGVLEAVAELGARLVVVGTAAGPQGFTVGSVARHLLHASPVPVALTPRGYKPAGRLRRIYCAVGTRPGAQLVVQQAVEAARRTRTDLRLVSLVDLDERAGVDDEARRRAEKLMQEAAAGVTDAVGIEIGQGRTMRQAIDSIGWEPRSVLLVGSSRLAPGRQTFLGTTAARMLRHLPVPMVVVPRSDRAAA
jgi:nucleotide-binding universal stress UspA family protein